jgi:hypothetical protein
MISFYCPSITPHSAVFFSSFGEVGFLGSEWHLAAMLSGLEAASQKNKLIFSSLPNNA